MVVDCKHIAPLRGLLRKLRNIYLNSSYYYLRSCAAARNILRSAIRCASCAIFILIHLITTCAVAPQREIFCAARYVAQVAQYLFEFILLLLAQLRRSAKYFAQRDMLRKLRNIYLNSSYYYLRSCAAARNILRSAMCCASCPNSLHRAMQYIFRAAAQLRK